MSSFQPAASVSRPLAAIGAVFIAGFLTVFFNIPWEWNMFMDDVQYNTWMPNITNVWDSISSEIRTYWSLGRFYPVKYLANLLKWRYLPNDPYIFRYFNLSVYFISVSVGAMAAMRAAGDSAKFRSGSIFLFLVGTSFLHKPLLETISLNPLGETWVCLFFTLGAYFLFSNNWFLRFFLARLFFALVALSKEPAALVFFASFCSYSFLAWAESSARRAYLVQAILDLIIFTFFLSIAIYAMSQGSFTKGAYFEQTPWLNYAKDFFYKGARYCLLTSPFVFIFLLCYRKLFSLFACQSKRISAAALFFCVFGFSYSVFMATQGIVAYQEIPASISFFCLFSLLICLLIRAGGLEVLVNRFGPLLLLLFSISFFISVSRWERFVRGIVEPKQAILNLLATGQEMTVLVPNGEVLGHIELLIKKMNPAALVFPIDFDSSEQQKNYRGKVFVWEFPYYMGRLDLGGMDRLGAALGGWHSVQEGRSYRIYRAQKEF